MIEGISLTLYIVNLKQKMIFEDPYSIFLKRKMIFEDPYSMFKLNNNFAFEQVLEKK